MLNKNPWDLTLRQRLGLLKPDTHRVAYFAPKPDSGSFRYRCYNTSQAINSTMSPVSASFFYRSDLDHLDDLPSLADSLVVFRTPYDTDIDRLITDFKRAGKKVYFDIDDLVFDVQFAPLVTSNLNYKLSGKDIDQWFAFIANIGACLNLCDEAITTNSFLAQRIKDFAHVPVTVIPNFVNDEQLEISDFLRPDKNFSRSGNGLALGYFSGSHSHAKDFDVAQTGVLEFLKKSPQSTLTVLGHLELTPALQELGTQVIRKDFVDFLELQREIFMVDVNLIPLQMSPFTFSKSELKFFEAGFVETISLATPTPLYGEIIDSGVNGFLSNAAQWHSKLLEIQFLTIEQRVHVAQQARTTAESLFSPQAIRDRLITLFASED